MLSRFTKQEFLTSGSWTAPAGVTRVMIWGMGGGAGGNQGSDYGSSFPNGGLGGRGGAGVSLQPFVINVVPNTTYTVTIGDGGLGGDINTVGMVGTSGGNSIFGNSIIEWKGALSTNPNAPDSGSPVGSFFSNRTFIAAASGNSALPAGGSYGGGPGVNWTTQATRGFQGKIGSSAAQGSLGFSNAFGGPGGSGQSGELPGGTGGTCVSTSVAGNGGNAPANSGAGGGGGSGEPTGSSVGAGGYGGNGGSGKIVIMWVE